VSTTSGLLGMKMLLATDGSKEAELAAKSAVELAGSTGSELHVVYVEPLPGFMKNGDSGTPGYDRGLYEMIEEEGREKLRKLVWRVKVAGGTVTGSHLRMGAVAEEIVGLAGELEVDLIIVGSRGLRGIRRAITGSVSEGVFRHARCPVMVVRPKGGNPPSWRGGRRARAWRGLLELPHSSSPCRENAKASTAPTEWQNSLRRRRPSAMLAGARKERR
jgi:nucleotide-binding universal stress UspA family protein